MIQSGMRPVHPGEILREEYLVPLNMTANALSKKLGATASRINEIVKEVEVMTEDGQFPLALDCSFTHDMQNQLPFVSAKTVLPQIDALPGAQRE